MTSTIALLSPRKLGCWPRPKHQLPFRLGKWLCSKVTPSSQDCRPQPHLRCSGSNPEADPPAADGLPASLQVYIDSRDTCAAERRLANLLAVCRRTPRGPKRVSRSLGRRRSWLRSENIALRPYLERHEGLVDDAVAQSDRWADGLGRVVPCGPRPWR